MLKRCSRSVLMWTLNLIKSLLHMTQTHSSITKTFLGQMLISYGSGFRHWKNLVSHFLSLHHKSLNSAAQPVLVSHLFPFYTMGINYIKAGLVNLAGASCRRHWELKLWHNEDHSSLHYVCVQIWSGNWTHARRLPLCLFSHFPVNKCLVSSRWPVWI